MDYLLHLLLALAPGLIWLLFFLRKDAHPESNFQVLKIFLYGILAAIIAALIGLSALDGLTKLNLSDTLFSLLKFFIAVALVEEVLKYLAVKKGILTNSEFDEPTDAVLYMIIASLGFATAENILIFFNESFFQEFSDSCAPYLLFLLRFWGATLLHALCSAIIGFAIAFSFFETKSRKKLLFLGLISAIALHGLFDFSIMRLEGILQALIPTIILVCLAFIVSIGFEKIKKMKSICKIN